MPLLAVPLLAFQSPIEKHEEPEDTGSIKRAVWADDRLWILDDLGHVLTVPQDKADLEHESIPEPVIDLALWGSHPAVLTFPKDGDTTRTVRRRLDGKWVETATFEADKERIVGLWDHGADATVVTTQRLIELHEGKQDSVPLSETLVVTAMVKAYRSIEYEKPLQASGVMTGLVTDDYVFVGVNIGEWGGGLRRIERKTGRVTVFDVHPADQVCRGILAKDCDPVTGLAVEPWNPKCIAASVGMSHFTSRGRIVEVCGDRVQRLYFRGAGEESIGSTSKSESSSDGEPSQSVGFFGVVRAGDDLLAAGTDGIYRMQRDGSVAKEPMPKSQERGGIRVSFGLPHVVLVWTTINGRLSVSESVPMLVSR
jgi:hypothetical protein